MLFTTMELAVNSLLNAVTLFCRLFTFVSSVFTLVWLARDETVTSSLEFTSVLRVLRLVMSALTLTWVARVETATSRFWLTSA